MRFLTLLPMGMLASCVTSHHTYSELSPAFSWANITATDELQYHDCGGGFQCARLQFPLDWNATADSPIYNEKFKMAIVRAPAQVPVTDPRYGGPIILNFGGPGAPGTYFAAIYAQALQTSFDAAYSYGSETYVSDHPDARYFDLVFFDPRGVPNSTPWYTPFNNPVQAASLSSQILATQLEWPPQFNNSYTNQAQEPQSKRNDDFDRLWQSNYAAYRGNIWDPVTNPGGSKIARFASTAMVARDLIELAERHGQWREKQVLSNNTDQELLHRLRWKLGEEPLLVSMISYGTILGTTLAAMQPHRDSRFHLDGVTDAKQYYAGELTSDVNGADSVVEKFFEYCSLAGPKTCPMWAGNSSTDARKRLKDIYTDLRLNGPIPVPGTPLVDPDIITLSDVKRQVLGLLYSPMTGWPATAEILAPLTHRNGTAFAVARQSRSAEIWKSLPSMFDPDDPTTAPSIRLSSAWAGAMIQGGGSSARLTQKAFAQERWAPLRKVTQWTGDQWASTYMPLFTWPISFDWRYGDKTAVASNVTAHPILFASSLYDGATSLRSARNMHAAFPGSGLLVTNAEGHTTRSEPSLCNAKAVRRYFQTGKLPDERVTCRVNGRPFLDVDGPGVEPVRELNKEDQVLFDAMVASLT